MAEGISCANLMLTVCAVAPATQLPARHELVHGHSGQEAGGGGEMTDLLEDRMNQFYRLEGSKATELYMETYLMLKKTTFLKLIS